METYAYCSNFTYRNSSIIYTLMNLPVVNLSDNYMDLNTWEQVCLACGIVTARQKRRLLSTLSRDNCIVFLLRRAYRSELAIKKQGATY